MYRVLAAVYFGCSMRAGSQVQVFSNFSAGVQPTYVVIPPTQPKYVCKSMVCYHPTDPTHPTQHPGFGAPTNQLRGPRHFDLRPHVELFGLYRDWDQPEQPREQSSELRNRRKSSSWLLSQQPQISLAEAQSFNPLCWSGKRGVIQSQYRRHMNGRCLKVLGESFSIQCPRIAVHHNGGAGCQPFQTIFDIGYTGYTTESAKESCIVGQRWKSMNLLPCQFGW